MGWQNQVYDPLRHNASGEITGTAQDRNYFSVAFVQSPAGVLTPFELFYVSYQPFAGTHVFRINASGTVVDGFTNGTFPTLYYTHATVCPQQRCYLIDVPGSTSATGFAINDQADIAGIFQNPNNVFHCFLLTSSGTFTFFDLPGGGFPQLVRITANDDIIGSFGDSNESHSFIRSVDGTVTQFDAPWATNQPNTGT
jgi:hypothetical protein